MSRSRPGSVSLALAASLLLMSACYPLFGAGGDGSFRTGIPLGAIAPGRGSPLPHRAFEVGLSLGQYPEMGGVVEDDSPLPDDLTTSGSVFAWLGLGMRAGVASWADVGLSASRGLHATLRVAGAGPWSLSVSPAWFRHTSGGESRGQGHAHVFNQNLTGLVAFRPGEVPNFQLELYGGSGVSRYSLEIPEPRSEGHGVSPTLVGGVTLELSSPPRRSEQTRSTLALGFETTNSWLAQRGGQRERVSVSRLQIALRSWPAW